MAAPSYVSDLTDIIVPSGTTDWNAFGGGASGLNNESDYYIVDSSCVSKNAWASDYKGMIYDNGVTLTIPSGDAVFVWITHLTPNSLGAASAGGIQVVMADNTTEAQFDEWYIAGSDTIVYDKRWICAPVDPTVTPNDNGSAAADYQYFGGGANLPTGGPTKGAPFAIDAIRYGREFQCTNGDLANGYATFDGAATYNDDSTRRYGQIQLSGGVYQLQGMFVMGTASTAVDFRDSNRSVVFLNNGGNVKRAFHGFEVRNASSRVDWNNITIESFGRDRAGGGHLDGDIRTGSFEMIDAADVNIDGCTFVNMQDFTFQSTGSATNCTWRGCAEIYAAGADLSGSSISDYSYLSTGGAPPVGPSALIWDVATNPDTLLQDMTFTKGTETVRAINFGTSSPTTMTFRNMTFNGYNASNGQSDSAIEFSRTTGTVTVTLIGTTQPSYSSSGATIEFVTNPVTVTARAVTKTGTAIQDANVFLYATSTTGSLPAEDSVTIANSGTTATVTHTAHGLISNDKVWIQGASLSENNGVFTITVTDANTYTYTMGSSPGSSPTGTITSTFVFFKGLTDVNGEISLTKSIPANQSVDGWARKSTSAPRYKQGPLVGTVSASADTTLTGVLVLDE